MLDLRHAMLLSFLDPQDRRRGRRYRRVAGHGLRGCQVGALDSCSRFVVSHSPIWRWPRGGWLNRSLRDVLCRNQLIIGLPQLPTVRFALGEIKLRLDSLRQSRSEAIRFVAPQDDEDWVEGTFGIYVTDTQIFSSFL